MPSGRLRASAISSARLRTGDSVRTMTTIGRFTRWMMGVKAVTGS